MDGLLIEKEILDRLKQKFRFAWTYHSCAIEGNSLTYGETKALLLHGITAQGKPLKDHCKTWQQRMEAAIWFEKKNFNVGIHSYNCP